MNEAKLTIYQKPTCTTCKQVYTILKESGVDFDSVNYFFEPIPKKKLKELLKKMNMKANDLLRKKEEKYVELGLDKRSYSEEELLDFMFEYPDLMQRPIVEKGERAILARPAERIREIL